MVGESSTLMTQLAGQWLESFQLVRLLGTGAMGAVYLAKDSVLRRDVAIKLIPRGTEDTDPERRERFLREARAAARLIHPHVVQIFQVGENEEFRFIAMEYVDGVTTSRAAKQQGGRLQEQFGIEKMREAADALRLAASFGICHRDIKPANMLLTPSGTLKIADFGLASHVEGSESIGPGSASQLEGTPFYMSPEQWSGGPVAASSDIYSLGCTFYHLLVGATPYGARDLIGCFQAHVLSPVPDPKAMMPEMDPLLSDLLRRCMAKRPEDRPGAADIVEVLDDMLLLRRSAVRSRASVVDVMERTPVETLGTTMDLTTQSRALPPAGVTPLPSASQTGREARSLLQSSSPSLQSSKPSLHSTAPSLPLGTLGRQSYHAFLGLKGYPFSDNRQPGAFWDAGPYAWAVRTLASQIVAGQRPTMLLGAPGTGRTFVSEMLRSKIPRIFTFAIEPSLVFGSRLLVALCKQYGATTVNPTASLRFLIEVFLGQTLPRDRPEAIATIVVDGVDPDDDDVLVELDELLRGAPLGRFSMVLLGQEDLPARLIARGAPSSLTTGAPPVNVRAMTQQEMLDYIDFRMKTVGGGARGLELDVASQQLLHARTGGNPKLINVYCHNALTIAAVAQESKIRLSMVRLAMRSKTYLTPDAAVALLRT